MVHVTEEWIDEVSLFAASGGLIVVDLRKFLLGADGPLPGGRNDADGSPKLTAKSQLRTWATLGLEPKGGLSVRRRLRPLSLREWGFVRTWSLFCDSDTWE